MIRGSAFVIVLLACATAAADPIALRQPRDGRSLTLVGGAPLESIAFHLDNGFGVAVTMRVPVTMIAVDAGIRRILAGDELGWSCVTTVWTGVAIPTLTPGFALDIGVAMHARLHHEWFIMQLGAALPVTLRLTNGFSARIPVLLDGWFGAQISRVTFGLQGSVGATFIDDLLPVPNIQGSVFIGVGL